MLKVIYPLTTNIGRRSSAWKQLHELCERFNVSASRPRLREETFENNIIFHHIGGEPMSEKRRVYTFIFWVEKEATDRLIARLCNREQRLARLLTHNTMLLCIDDDLAVRPLGSG